MTDAIPVTPGSEFRITGDMALLAPALAQAQSKFAAILRTKTVNTPKYAFKYAPLEDLLAAVLPALNDAKFALMMPHGRDAHTGRYVLRCVLFHAAGTIEAIDDFDVPQTVQDLGAQLTYRKRYLLAGLLALASDDDTDGHAPSEPGIKVETRPPKAPPADPLTADTKDSLRAGKARLGLSDAEAEALCVEVTGKGRAALTDTAGRLLLAEMDRRGNGGAL